MMHISYRLAIICFMWNGHKKYRSNKLIAQRKRTNIRNSITRSCVYFASLEDLPSFQTNGQMTLQQFKENISKLFPLIVELIVKGESVTSIERLFGMKERSLKQFIDRTPKARKAVEEARTMRLDKLTLEEMLS